MGWSLQVDTFSQTLGVLSQSIKPGLSDDVSIKDRSFLPWMALNKIQTTYC